ncbi:MAG: LemA family protein, partial [Candidatus Paceibacteria bacterium]
ARRFYNSNVRDYNTAIASFPTNLVAGAFGFGPKELFEIEEEGQRQPVKVSF